jgi:hypothetical protein
MDVFAIVRADIVPELGYSVRTDNGKTIRLADVGKWEKK